MSRPLRNALAKGWHELTRPRHLPGRKAGRRAQKSRGGLAILVVVAAVMVLTVLVTEITYGAQVRFLVAHHQKERVQAYWLARSGYNIYQLLLAANNDLANSGALDELDAFMPGASAYFGDALWNMVPTINTGLFRMLLGSGGDVDDIDEETLTQFRENGRVDDEDVEEAVSASMFNSKSFLEFEGDFSAEVTDHESKINVNLLANDDGLIQDSTTAQMLFALMSGEENDAWFRARNLDRWELIGNLKDWVDADNTRSAGLGGYEDNLYNKQDPPYLSKNAPFDTQEEIRLVEGWQDDVFERFGENITVYGPGKLNIGNLSEDMPKAMIRSMAASQPTDTALQDCADNVQFYASVTPLEKYTDLVSMMETYCGNIPMAEDPNTSGFSKSVTSSSQTFTVTSTGLAGTSSVTITAVLDFSSRGSGKLVYWRVD